MPRKPKRSHRWLTAASWPVGVVLTSWDYTWRVTPIHRREIPLSTAQDAPLAPSIPPGVDVGEVQASRTGYGPLFNRRYRVRIRETSISPEELIGLITADLNAPTPTKFARFLKVSGGEGEMVVGDEYVVRMPGPWDGPVRVVSVTPTSFRFATLAGHLEAGQIEFRARREGMLTFEIESWARSSGRLSNLLYHHIRMAKEIQLHMWISFLEGVVALSGGRMTGGLFVDTNRLDDVSDG